MLHTRLTELLECDHPVMLAGMGGVAYAELVAAVSEAGGFGTLGAAPMSLDRMNAELTAIRQRTDRPFGVDLLTALPGGMHSQVEAIIAGGASLFVAGLGVPRDVIDLCHHHGVLVASMCGRVRHAVAAVEAGCDIVIAQGTEAGGHTGLVATMPDRSIIPRYLRAAALAAEADLQIGAARARAEAIGRGAAGGAAEGAIGAAGLTANATILGAREADGVGTIKPVPVVARTATTRPGADPTTTIPATTVPKFSAGAGFKQAVAGKKAKK